MAHVQISLPDPVLARIDNYAKSIGVSRSSFLALAAAEYLDAKEAMPKLSGVLSSMAQALDSKIKGDISEDEYQLMMADLERQAKSIGAN